MSCKRILPRGASRLDSVAGSTDNKAIITSPDNDNGTYMYTYTVRTRTRTLPFRNKIE